MNLNYTSPGTVLWDPLGGGDGSEETNWGLRAEKPKTKGSNSYSTLPF